MKNQLLSFKNFGKDKNKNLNNQIIILFKFNNKNKYNKLLIYQVRIRIKNLKNSKIRMN